MTSEIAPLKTLTKILIMVFSGCDAMWLIQYAEEMNIRNLNLATCANGLKLEDLTAQRQKLAEKCNFEQPEGMR